MTSNNYGSFCDDFYLDMYINTKLDLLMQRDTILVFFERIQKQFPSMGRFYRLKKNEYCLEEDSHIGQYRWITLETDRIGSGFVNPPNFEEAFRQDRLVLELAPYMLSVSHLDINSLDVVFAMDFDYVGNHDEIIAEALLGQSPLSCLLDLPQARPIDFSPAVVVALSEDSRTQARISIESRTSVYEPGKQRQRLDETSAISAEPAINLSFTIRQYPTSSEKFDALKSFEYQCQLAQELMAEKIIPNFVRPLTKTIAQKRLT